MSNPIASGAIGAVAAIHRTPGAALHLEPVEVTAPRAREVRVRILGCGICHTDIVAMQGGLPVPLPIVLGHEGAGIVEAVGSDVVRVRPGDAVVLSFSSCGCCVNCADGQPAYCYEFARHNFASVRPEDGSTAISKDGTTIHGHFFGQSSFATYAIANERNVVKVDPQLPLAILGPFGCGFQTGAGAIMNSLKVKGGQSLVIFGGGSVGLSALLAAVAIGARNVIVVEPNPARRELALELGASTALDPKSVGDIVTAIREASGGGVQHALDTTGIASVINSAVDTLLPNGVLGLLGVPGPEDRLSAKLMDMLMRGLGVKYIIEGDSDPQVFIPQLLELYQQGRFPFEKLIQRFPFERIQDALNASENGTAIKAVVTFP